MKRSVVSPLLVAALALGGCMSAALRPLPPAVSLQSMSAGLVAGAGAQARLHFAVHNPNAYELRVTTFEYQVRIDDREVGGGALAQPVVLAADAVTPVDVDVRMDFRVLGAALDHARRHGSLGYDLDGSVVLDNGMSLPFHKHGTFAMPASPAAG